MIEKDEIETLKDAVVNMDLAWGILDSLPEGCEYTPDEIDLIDEVRYAAMRLDQIAKSALDEFMGKHGEPK